VVQNAYTTILMAFFYHGYVSLKDGSSKQF